MSKPLNTLDNKFFGLLSLPSTAMGFALCVQIAALSWILNTKFGFNLEDIGWIWAAGPMAGILGQVIVGVISDNVWFWNGRRRPFILIGGTLAALMLLALPNIGVISSALGFKEVFGVALLIALTLDLAINISFNPTRSIIADVTPDGPLRTKGYTWMQTISGFFGVCAYLIGAFIGNETLIYVGFFVVLAFSVFPILYVKEPRDLLNTGDDKLDEVVVRETDWTEFLKICFAHAFTWLGVQTMFIYTFGYIKSVIMGYELDADLSTAQNDEMGFMIGIAFAILNTVGFILPATVLEPIAKKIGRVKTHMLSIAVMSLGYFMLAKLGGTQTSLFAMMAIIGIGWAAVVSLPFAIMSETVSQARMGFFMGLFNLSVVLPQLVSSSIGKYFDGQADKSMIFMVCGISLAISALLWLLVKEQKSSLENA